MKRFALIIFFLAVFTGALAPVTASLTTQNTIVVQRQQAFAQIPDSRNQPAGLPSKDITTSKGQNNLTSGSDAIMDNISCGIVFGSFAGCLEYIFYFIPYTVGGWLMSAGAYILDTLASLTLSSALYTKSTFIGDGWRLTRDFSNIFFIIILLFAALSLTLGIEIGHANPKKMLVSVILIAVLINFSMFITDVVIDLSNSLALVFYNQITLTYTPPIDPSAPAIPNSVVPPKSITTALVQAFQPQQLQSKTFWDGLKTGDTTTTHPITGAAVGAAVGTGITPVIGTAIGAVVGGLAGAYISTTVDRVPATVMIGVLLLVGGMFCVVAYSFLIASISFVGRLVGLWIAIIFAPFAFVSYIIPSARNIEGFGWSKWWESLITMAFGAPIYFFFLLLISLMTKSSIVTFSGTSFQILITLSITFMFLIIMLIKATNYAKKASGELGALALKAAGALGGLALMAVSGGASQMLSRTVGAYNKSRITEDKQDMAAGKVTSKTKDMVLSKIKDPHRWAAVNAMSETELSKSAEFTKAQRDMSKNVKRNQKLASSSFDFRQTAIGNAFSSATGIGMEGFKFGDKSFFHSEGTAGGYEGIKNKKAAKDRKFAESLGLNHEQQIALEESVEKRELEIEKTENELKRLEAEVKNLPAGHALDVAKAQVVAQQEKLNKLRSGDDAAGNWTNADRGRVKINGERVDDLDVSSGHKKTEAMGLTEMKKTLERNKDARKMAFLHQQMVQPGYEVHGEKYDGIGQLKKMGHIDYNNPLSVNTMRGWGNSFMANVAKGFRDGAIIGAAAGAPLLAGAIGTAITGGVLGAMREAILMAPKIMPGTNIYTQRNMDAKSATLAADTKHEIHEFHSKYKTPGNGFFDSLKKIIGGDGGGGGGHGHGHGDDHSKVHAGH